MKQDYLSTDGVERSRQYQCWREAVSHTHLAWNMPARREAAFSGNVNRRTLSGAEVLECACDPCAGNRGRAELAHPAPGLVGVLCVLSGREKLSQPGGDTFLQAGRFALWDSQRPLAFEVPERLHKITLMVPREVLQAVLVELDPHLGVSFDATDGCGALFVAQLRGIAALPNPLGARAQRTALRVALELLGSAVESAQTERSAAGTKLHARVVRYIGERLSDPELSSEQIARAVGLSRRQLDRSFAHSGTSVARYIWSERLERCRQDALAEEREGLLNIAFRWGFSDAAHFSRAFRRAFGASPREYRAQRLGNHR